MDTIPGNLANSYPLVAPGEPVPSELINFIKNNSDFIIAGHKEPDGDCIGSQLALCSALRRTGKNAIVCSAGPFIRSDLKDLQKQFIPVPAKTNKDTKLIIVDCSSMERTGNIQQELEKFPYAIIDHHSTFSNPDSTEQAPVYIDKNAPSCTILIEKLINALGLELTKEEAEHLLFGLCTDTGFFRHLTENNADILESASRMIRCGASPKKCYYAMYGRRSLNSRKLMGNILSRTESFFNGKLLLSYETKEDIKKFGIESRDSDILNQLLLSIDNVEVTAIIRQEQDDSCTVSLRSIDKVDVAKVASSFGGGGHKNASGMTLTGDIEKLKNTLLDTFNQILN